MLETIREFAAERLERLGDAGELRDRHAAWYVELGERARPALHARQQSEWLDRHLIVNAAAFYSKYDGIQLTYQVVTSPVTQNAGNAEIKGLEPEVRRIVDDVRRGGDRKLRRYAVKWDGVGTRQSLRVSEKELALAWQSLAPRLRKSLRQAAQGLDAGPAREAAYVRERGETGA